VCCLGARVGGRDTDVDGCRLSIGFGGDTCLRNERSTPDGGGVHRIGEAPNHRVCRWFASGDPPEHRDNVRIGDHGDTILPNEQPAPAGAIRARYVDSRADWVFAAVSSQAGSMEPVVPARRACIGNSKISLAASRGRSKQTLGAMGSSGSVPTYREMKINRGKRSGSSSRSGQVVLTWPTQRSL